MRKQIKTILVTAVLAFTFLGSSVSAMNTEPFSFAVGNSGHNFCVMTEGPSLKTNLRDRWSVRLDSIQVPSHGRGVIFAPVYKGPSNWHLATTAGTWRRTTGWSYDDYTITNQTGRDYYLGVRIDETYANNIYCGGRGVWNADYATY